MSDVDLFASDSSLCLSDIDDSKQQQPEQDPNPNFTGFTIPSTSSLNIQPETESQLQLEDSEASPFQLHLSSSRLSLTPCPKLNRVVSKLDTIFNQLDEDGIARFLSAMEEVCSTVQGSKKSPVVDKTPTRESRSHSDNSSSSGEGSPSILSGKRKKVWQGKYLQQGTHGDNKKTSGSVH